MKRQHLGIIFCFLWFAAFSLPQQCFARDVVKGQITDAIRERIALSNGDKVTVSIGKAQGLIRGDIGKIFSKTNTRLEIGRCVIEENNKDSSVCQIIESNREIGRGDAVLFDAVDYRDKVLLLPIVDFLDSSVKMFPSHEKVRILIHEIFDGKNNITQLSEKVRGELIYIASQKKRITPEIARDIANFSYYPNEYGTFGGQMKDLLRKRSLDMLVTGTCETRGNILELSFQRVLRDGDDRVIVFPLAATSAEVQKSATIVLPYVKKEKYPDSVCSVVYKPRQYLPLKEEKSAIIKDEAGGDPFKELTLKRVEFNIISPVQFNVSIDGTMVNIAENGVGKISLGSGSHRIHASFRRGFYSNESLLYTSGRELVRDAMLELNHGQEVMVEILADPLPDKGDSLAFRVYRKAERERHALKPIPKLDSEKVVETFVE